MNNEYNMPNINFEPLVTRSKEELYEKIYNNTRASCFLVYLRCKYEHEIKWEYLIECCGIYGFNDLMWMNDWYEGQQDVEYLGIAIACV